jgi:predicted oxidoreductase
MHTRLFGQRTDIWRTEVYVNARVLDGDGLPIEGLYAGGEVVGIYYGTYTGATSMPKGLVFGRLGGCTQPGCYGIRNSLNVMTMACMNVFSK